MDEPNSTIVKERAGPLDVVSGHGLTLLSANAMGGGVSLSAMPKGVVSLLTSTTPTIEAEASGRCAQIHTLVLLCRREPEERNTRQKE